ncbi:MAG: ABC transporter ATP-binding protein [Pseudomonadota bacterium]
MSEAVNLNRPVFQWVWSNYLKRYWKWLLLAFVLMSIEGGTLGALSYLMKPMFDQVFIAGDQGAVTWVAGAIAGIFLLRAVTAFAHRVIMETVGLRIITTMQRDLVGHFLTLDSAFFQSHPPGTLIERVRGDTAAANAIWATVLGAAGRDFFALVGLLAVAISVDPIWTLIAIAGVPLLFGPIAGLLRYVRGVSYEARERAARLATRLDEIFHGVNTIKLNTSEAHENGRFGQIVRELLRYQRRALVGRAAVPGMIDIVAALGFAGVIFYGGGQIIDGDKTVGEFMSFFTAMGLIFDPLRRFANVGGAWVTAQASLVRILHVFDETPTITSPAQPIKHVADQTASDITLKDVVLRYQGETALNGVTFTARGGETTALVGASGAGKSSVFNILTRLVDVDSGAVTVGNAPIDQLDLGDLRRLFAVVSQEAPMFDESLRDNILLADTKVSDDHLTKVLDAAHLSEFVSGLPMGLDTPVGPRGSKLSGGQRQRVAIARALLRNAPILLLDEATSALDAESEVRVQQALEHLSQNRTTLVIAHRLSTVRAAHKIVVMDKGRVLDEGRHEELLARGGVYARLYALQFDE